ncbi:MAG: alpha/beta hydrolase [Clostridiales bacterium]|nr:alpha/beta hydrolase [Clostridiales bacterium]
MKRLISLILTVTMLLACMLPSVAAAKKMEAGVPVWTEETVRAYLDDYIAGNNLSTLYGYYDLQIRRYMPQVTYECMLTELEWMTGAFIQQGDYFCFEEPERNSKTHVVHLHMEKQDLEVYFTHKNYEDDWEVMGLDFIPAVKADLNAEYGVDAETYAALSYVETPVTVGNEYPLSGVLTMPAIVAQGEKIPAVVLVHDEGPMDMNATVGATAFFEDLAHELAEMGIASIRYDKRTYVYGEDDVTSAWDEVVEDAILAGKMLADDERVDTDAIVVIGHGFGALLTPRIVSQSEGIFDGMVLIGGRPVSYTNQLLEKADLSGMTSKEAGAFRELVIDIEELDENEARSLELFGRNGYYFWEMEQFGAISLIQRLGLPTYIVQGQRDHHVSEEDGWRAYREELKNYGDFVNYNCYQGLNHMLSNDLSTDENGMPQYAVDAEINIPAVRDIGQWIFGIQP